MAHRGPLLDGWIEWQLEPEAGEARLRVAPALAPALAAVIARTRHALDLDADPALLEPAMPLRHGSGMRLPGSFDPFESAVRIVRGQQVRVAAARTLATRLVHALGRPLATPWPELNRLFPDAAALAAADPELIGRLGIVRQRVRALQALAAAVAEGRIVLVPQAPLAETLDALRALPGIGEWTTQMIALRVLAWPDAFPASDIGVLRALDTRDAHEALRRAEPWRPWRGYAVLRLWQTLEQA